VNLRRGFSCSALGKGMFNHLCPMHPWKKGVLSAKIVVVHVNEGEKTVDEFVENIVGLLRNVVPCLVVARSSQEALPQPKEVSAPQHHPDPFQVAGCTTLMCINNLPHHEQVYRESNLTGMVFL